MKQERKRISAYISKKDHEKVKTECVKQNITMTQAVKLSLIEYINKCIEKREIRICYTENSLYYVWD